MVSCESGIGWKGAWGTFQGPRNFLHINIDHEYRGVFIYKMYISRTLKTTKNVCVYSSFAIFQ